MPSLQDLSSQPILPNCRVKDELCGCSFGDFVVTDGQFGEGAFGTIREAKQTGFAHPTHAIKIIDLKKVAKDLGILPSDPRYEILKGVQEAKVEAEVAALRRLTHSSILSLADAGSQGSLFWIATEVVSGVDLFDHFLDNQPLQQDQVRSIVKQLVEAVKFCHSKGVAHRDIKLENAMLTRDGLVKLIDFGLCHVYAEQEDGTFQSGPLSEGEGSDIYCAPEVQRIREADAETLLANKGGVYDPYMADVWSCGVCLFVLNSGFQPWARASTGDANYRRHAEVGASQLYSHLVTKYKSGSAASLTPDLQLLLDGLLEVDPSSRCGLEQALQSSWCRGNKRGLQGEECWEEPDRQRPRWRSLEDLSLEPSAKEESVVDVSTAPVLTRQRGWHAPSLHLAAQATK